MLTRYMISPKRSQGVEQCLCYSFKISKTKVFTYMEMKNFNFIFIIFGISFRSVSLDLHLTTHHLKYLPTYTFTTLPSISKKPFELQTTYLKIK